MKQLPQNLKAVLQDIAEDSVLLRLSMLLVEKPGWKVYRSYAEDSCDIVLRRTHGRARPGYRKELRIEVKARQNMVTERKGQQMHFTVSKAERESCHFLVAFWFERGDYFVVPKKELKPASKAGKSFCFVVNLLKKTNDYNKPGKKFRNRWDRIGNLLKRTAHG